MKKFIIYINFLSLFCFSIVESNAFAFSTYFNQSPIGWHWNNQVDNTDNTENDLPQKQQDFHSNTENPIQKMHRIHALLRFYKDQAVLNPTVENIRQYLMFQNMVMEQSSIFEKNWKETMLLYPEFDYGINHPTDSEISQLNQTNLHKKQIALVKTLSKQFGLLFFYNGGNPLSAQMEKTVETFSQFYGFSMMTVSVDHEVIPGISNTFQSKLDHGQALALGVKALPALVLVNPKTGDHFILTYGYASIDQLLTDCYQTFALYAQSHDKSNGAQ